MPLPAPNLDDRRFEDLLREARNRIPRFTPEWTNFNPSDPGMTLVELHAWMTETILYRLNQVPELNYIKFLDLLGIEPLPAYAARAELALELAKLDKPSDALTVPVPRSLQFSVDDKDLEEIVTFETDRSFIAINADFGMVVAPSEGDTEFPRQLLTTYDDGGLWARSFHPFGTPPNVNSAIYLGLVLRPNLKEDLERYASDVLPTGPLSLFADAAQIDDPDPAGAPVPGPMPVSCGGAGRSGPRLTWQIYTGQTVPPVFTDADDSGWTDLNLSLDETQGLSRTGTLTLEVPRGAVAVSPNRLPMNFWGDMGLSRAPKTYDELITFLPEVADLSQLTPDHWETMGVTDPTTLDEIAACGTDVLGLVAKLNSLPADDRPDPSRLTDVAWAQIEPDTDTPLPMAGDNYRPLYWLRAIYRAAGDEGTDPVALLQQFRLNTVTATQAATYRDQALGTSNGRPAQTFSLPKTPVLIDPDSFEPTLDLLVGEEDNWERVTDFYRSGPDSPHYQFDPVNGVVTFGDGLRGRIPVAQSRITALEYRIGGGAIGNVGPNTITKLKGRVTGLKGATNPRAAHDGSDAETLDAVKLRAPHELRHRDRAVTARDFSDLALRTPGVALHSATALSRRAIDAGALIERDGAVTLVLLPSSDDPRPVPTRAQLRAVCDWLEPRRLITTELHLTQPTYADVTRLAADITVADDADFGQVSAAIYESLLTFLHPVRGGKDGNGWPFGAAIYHADIYDRMLAVDGVARAASLVLDVAGGHPDKIADITTLPEAALPVLERGVIELVLRYG